MRKFIRTGAIVALAVVGLLGSTGRASADVTATIELHFRYCPPGAVDVFADCHDNPIVGFETTVSGGLPESALTNAEGNATFTRAEGGEFAWFYDNEVVAWPDDYVTSYCSVDGGDGSDIESKVSGNRTPVEPGDYIVCDIYFWNWEMDPIHGGAETPNTGAGPMTTGASAAFVLAGAVALGGLALASRKRALR